MQFKFMRYQLILMHSDLDSDDLHRYEVYKCTENTDPFRLLCQYLCNISVSWSAIQLLNRDDCNTALVVTTNKSYNLNLDSHSNFFK